MPWGEEEDSPLERARSPEGSPEEQFFWRERVRETAERIARLPELQRKALCLYAVEGRSYLEIAGMLHKSVPQIKILIHRARKRLEREMDGI